MNPEDLSYNIVGIIFFTIVTLICFYPFYYLLICTISDQKLVDLNRIVLFPQGINFKNYVEIFQVQNLGNAALVSVARTVCTTAVSLVSLRGYYHVLLCRYDPRILEQQDAGPD